VENGKELKFADKSKVAGLVCKKNEIYLESSQLPIIIIYEGRKKYILNKTAQDKLILQKKADA
jgi:hypothetical protein